MDAYREGDVIGLPKEIAENWIKGMTMAIYDVNQDSMILGIPGAYPYLNEVKNNKVLQQTLKIFYSDKPLQTD